MVPGKPLKHVYAAAVRYLRDAGKEDLVQALPKTLGFGVGIDFRDAHLLLNTKNTVAFRPGMVFSLVTSLGGLTLSEDARAACNGNSAVSMECVWRVCGVCAVGVDVSGRAACSRLGGGVGDHGLSSWTLPQL